MIIQTNSRARQGPQIHVKVKVYNLQVATIVHGVVSGFFIVHTYMLRYFNYTCKKLRAAT